MFRTRLTSKIHRLSDTHCGLHHEKSCAIAEDLREAAGMRAHQAQRVFVDEANRRAGRSRFVPTQPF